MAGPWIALLTDFSTNDTYVGVLKGVLAAQCPQARPIDLAHQIPPGDVAAAALMLWQAAPYFPAGSVFLCVVDPGVGSARRGLAAAWRDKLFVGPDNGLISYWLETEPAQTLHELSSPTEPARQTFHGRDVFAPAAAQLVSGTPIHELGARVDDPVRLPRPKLRATAQGNVEGELLRPDGFGNWLTSIGVLTRSPGGLSLRPWLGGNAAELGGTEHLVRLPDGEQLPLRRTFSDVPPGSALAYIGSSGLLEIGVNQGSAAERLGLLAGQPVQLWAKG